MKRHACRLILASAAALAAAPGWGAEIVKCVDRDGHLTLTDQPCPEHSTTYRLDSAAPVLPAAARDRAARALDQRRGPSVREARHLPMPRDVATLKAARAQQLLLDSGGKSQPASQLAVN